MTDSVLPLFLFLDTAFRKHLIFCQLQFCHIQVVVNLKCASCACSRGPLPSFRCNCNPIKVYYLPGSERENQYLQGGATPSTRQTLQYLLRNDVIDNVEALTAEIAYLIREREEAETEAREADTDQKDLRIYLDKCKQSFDKYLGMVFQSEIDEATDMAKAALARKKKRSS